MRKRPRAWILLVAVGLLLGVVLGGRPVRVERYQYETVGQVEWGNGQGQLAWVEGRDGNRYGPRSFDVSPQGELFVLDTFNARVCRWGPGGIGGHIPLDGNGYDHLVCFPDGTLALADNERGRVVWLDQAGKVLAEHKVRPEDLELHLIEGLAAGKDVLYVQEAGWESTGFFRRVSYLAERGEKEGLLSAVLVRVSGVAQGEGGVVSEAVQGLAVAPGGDLYLDLRCQDGFVRRVRVLSPRMEARGDIELRTGSFLGQGRLVGVDGRGYLFFVLAGDDGTYRVHRFAPSGEEKDVLPLPPSTHVRLGRLVRVDGRGNVYYLRAGETCMSLDRYRLEHGWEWRPR